MFPTLETSTGCFKPVSSTHLGRKERHGAFRTLREHVRRAVRYVQIRAALLDRQCFVCGITADVCTELHGVHGLGQKMQVRAVGVIDEQ